MAKFRDRADAEWSLVLDVGLLTEVRRETGLNLTKPDDSAAALADPMTFAGALWVLCREEAERAGLTPEQFARRLDPDTIDRAGDALLESLIDFFHRRRGGPAKARLPELLRVADRRAGERLAEMMESAIASNSAGNSPASSGSTPPG